MRIGFKLTSFKKILLFFLIVVVVPTISISSIYIYNYSVELKDKYKNMLNQDMSNLSIQLQALMSETDRLSLQLTLLTSLNSILMKPDKADMYDYYLLHDNLINQTSLNGMLESAYIYFRLNGRVLTTNEGLYSLDTFYDKTYIDSITSRNSQMEYQSRQVKSNSMEPPINVITLNRTLPFTNRFTLGSLVVNLKKDVFFATLQKMTRPNSGDFLILDLDHKETLFHNGDLTPSSTVLNYMAGQKLSKSKDIIDARLNGQTYFLSYEIVPSSSWLLVTLIPNKMYKQEFFTRLTSASEMTSVIICLGLLLSYLFALIVHKPWRAMVQNYPFILKTASQNHSLDEYSLISTGIDHLLQENSQIKSVIKQVEPLAKHRLIYDLLHYGFSVDGEPHRSLEQNGIRFVASHYMVCVVSPELKTYEMSKELQKIRLVLFGLVENSFGLHMEVAGTLIDEGRFAFILGLPEDYLELSSPDPSNRDHNLNNMKMKGLCHSINRKVHVEFSTGLQFSFGQICRSISELHESYTDANRGLNFKALLNKSDVVFVTDLPNEKGFLYPYSLQKMLLEGIKNGNKKQSQDAISILFEQYVHNEKFPPNKSHQIIIIFISSVIHELLEEGNSIDQLNIEIVTQIDYCDNRQELERMMLSHIDQIIDRLDSSTETRSSENSYVTQSLHFIEENYQRNISISDVADHVGLSPNYLSRIFKAETGCSPLDYLSRYRIEQGKQLLIDERRLTLQEIAPMIGYHDVQSFIRFFKKYEDVTPNVYRKIALK